MGYGGAGYWYGYAPSFGYEYGMNRFIPVGGAYQTVVGAYGGYGPYGASAGYGPYGAYGAYDPYGSYGPFGAFGSYGPYGASSGSVVLQEPMPGPNLLVTTPAVLPPKSKVATVDIFVADPKAEVWFNGAKVDQMGQQRLLTTPDLEAGKAHSFEVRAKWTQNGKEYDKTRTVTVKAGEQVGLTFVAGK
jgi:uncharacterized protein (TIGR03000 family)